MYEPESESEERMDEEDDEDEEDFHFIEGLELFDDDTLSTLNLSVGEIVVVLNALIILIKQMCKSCE